MTEIRPKNTANSCRRLIYINNTRKVYDLNTYKLSNFIERKKNYRQKSKLTDTYTCERKSDKINAARAL